MKQVDWGRLPELVRARFVESARGNGPAAALYFVPFRPTPTLGVRALLLGTAALAVLYSWTKGFGIPRDADALASGWLCPSMALGVAGYAAAAFVVGKMARSSSGLEPGTYLFATHCVEVVRDTLTVWPLADLSKFEANPGPNGIVVHLRFGGDTVRLHVEGGAEAQKRLANCASVIRAAELARKRTDWAWLAARDPIGNLDRISGSESRTAVSLPTMTRVLLVIASAALGAISAPVRTLASDAAVIHAIQRAPSTASWRWYIEAGGRQAAEAQATWLPQAVQAEDEAAFQAALASDTSTALRDYLAKYAIHADEVRDTVLPRAALREAVASGSITKLRAFIGEFSGPAQGPFREDAAREIAARYEEALVTLQGQVPAKDRDLRRYFQRLFSWLSASPDGRVDVVFKALGTSNLGAADRLYGKMYGDVCGSIESLETNFGPAALAGSQAKVFDGLTRSFHKIVSNEALDLVQAEEESADHPSITVAYAVKTSGTVYFPDQEKDGDHHSDCFIGTRIKFDVHMTIPGERTHYDLSVNVVPPDRFETTERSRAWLPTASTDHAGQVYSVMTGLAFEQLAEGFRQRLFDPDSIAYDEMLQFVDSQTQ